MWLGEHHRNWALAALFLSIGAGVAGLGDPLDERQFRNGRSSRCSRSQTTQVLDSVHFESAIAQCLLSASDSNDSPDAEVAFTRASLRSAHWELLTTTNPVPAQSADTHPVASRGPPSRS